MQAVSPRTSLAAHALLSHNPAGDVAMQRPQLMKRQSSQSSHTSKHTAISPGSVGDYPQPRHHVKPGRKKMVLPRTHGSGRNLAKLAQQVQNQQAVEEERRGSRPRDSDSEIRLPRSLEDTSTRPLRRNFTATYLPRNTSHTKLKKNLSHGQLTKLALHPTALKGPPSPASKARNKRPKSADMAEIEKDLHEQEVEIARRQQDKKEAPKKVGFAVGSSDGLSDDGDMPQMEGQGLQEDEWTDQSASASPYSTRQNTANNSRRASMVMDKSLERRAMLNITEAKGHDSRHPQAEQHDVPTSSANGLIAERLESVGQEPATTNDESKQSRPYSAIQFENVGEAYHAHSPEGAPHPKPQRTLPRNAREQHINPATRHLLTRSTQSPVPALVSNVSALDSVRGGRSSPAPSTTSVQSSTRLDGPGEPEQEQEELVSRFMPSTSHPLTGSGANTTSTTPKSGSFHTPESESVLAATRGAKSGSAFSIGPVSPESARSLSSSTQTPAFSRWRNEEKLANEKAMAELEDAASHHPIVPAHVFDRRNESLKSYLNLASMGGDGRGGLHPTTGLSKGPEIFEGRFKAVNAELKVVQRFRDPLAECIERLQLCKGRDFAELRKSKILRQREGTKIQVSRSTTSLPRQPSKLSTSMSPPRSASPNKGGAPSGRSITQIKRVDNRRSKVMYSPADLTREQIQGLHEADGRGADDIARRLWDSAGRVI